MTGQRLSEEAVRGRLTIVDIAHLPTISVPAAGRVLGIGRDAAYAAATRGELPVLRLGRTLRCPVPKLLELLGVTSETAASATEIDLEDSDAAPDQRGIRSDLRHPEEIRRANSRPIAG